MSSPSTRTVAGAATGAALPGVLALGGVVGVAGPDEPEPNPHDARVARSAPPLLAEFNGAGVLAPADVHVAVALGRLVGVDDPEVLLGAALAVRAPRLQHVCADLATVRDTVTADQEAPVELGALAWPDLARWLVVLRASGLVADGPDQPQRRLFGTDPRPLRLVGTRLYLDRYWRYEQLVAAELHARSRPVGRVDGGRLRAGLGRLFPPAQALERPDRQRLAAATAVLRHLAVIAGGPGTGKTTTVAKVLALLDEQAEAAGDVAPRVALAAPTGKAADRLEEAVRETAAALDTSDDVRARLADVEAATIHRLLRWRPGSRVRFRHDRRNPLPHDVVVVDETSMVSLPLVAKLLDAVRPDARVVLLGDPEQLASVEAGAVLGDVVGPATSGLRMSAAGRAALNAAGGEDVPASDPPAGSVIGDGVVVLRRVHRFAEGSGIAELASAIQRGDADTTIAVLRDGPPDVRWLVTADDGAEPDAVDLGPVRAAVAAVGGEVFAAARRGDARTARGALERLRILCAHRRGPFGVRAWVAQAERWLAEDVPGFDPTHLWYVGRPVLVTENDYQLGLMNGDVGVVVSLPDGRVTVAFQATGRAARGRTVDGMRLISPTRLDTVETVQAMTVHKSQGSQFADVVVVLPDRTSPLLTRELLYTAVTRAREGVTVIGAEAAVRAAVGRPIQRASGLRETLWGPGAT